MAVHEIGHVLGLHHNNNRQSIMYPSYRLFRRGRFLSEFDHRSIQALYGMPKDDKSTSN